jgi:hypothetical protein
MPFILNEDKALKTLLTGITVSDDKNASRPVGVWFGQPDVEIRAQAYPYITIDLINVQEAYDRAARGILSSLDYTPEDFEPIDEGYGELIPFPIPYNLDYQISTFARHPRHDRQILSELHRVGLTSRYNSLDIEEDGTVRFFYVMQTMKRDRTEEDRRLFCNIFNIRVHSELYLGTNTAYKLVDQVNVSSVYSTVPFVQEIP